MDWIGWLVPWEVSPTLLTCFVVAGWLFVRGCRVHHVNRIRKSFFWVGMVMLYLSLHTMLDYYAERMFFMHRIQHLVLQTSLSPCDWDKLKIVISCAYDSGSCRKIAATAVG